jgi:hypothetical protein
MMRKAMRRYPQRRSPDPVQLVRDLVHDDALNLALFDRSPEPPIGGKARSRRGRRLRLFACVVAAIWILVDAIVVALV